MISTRRGDFIIYRGTIADLELLNDGRYRAILDFVDESFVLNGRYSIGEEIYIVHSGYSEPRKVYRGSEWEISDSKESIIYGHTLRKR